MLILSTLRFFKKKHVVSGMKQVFVQLKKAIYSSTTAKILI